MYVILYRRIDGQQILPIVASGTGVCIGEGMCEGVCEDEWLGRSSADSGIFTPGDAYEENA
jgi:hypothetical protein